MKNFIIPHPAIQWLQGAQWNVSTTLWQRTITFLSKKCKFQSCDALSCFLEVFTFSVLYECCRSDQFVTHSMSTGPCRFRCGAWCSSYPVFQNEDCGIQSRPSKQACSCYFRYMTLLWSGLALALASVGGLHSRVTQTQLLKNKVEKVALPRPAPVPYLRALITPCQKIGLLENNIF